MKRVGESTSERQRASYPNHVWSCCFVSDQTENGSNFRVLTLIDEYTRQWKAVHVAWNIRAVDVITVVEAAMERFGVPEHIRSDNGPESKQSVDSLPEAARRASIARQFIAYAIQDWLKEKKVKSIYITPGSPWEWSSSDIELSVRMGPGGVRREPNQNGHIESFHGKLRDELLNREVFGSLLEAKVLVESHRIEYDQNRPHSSLGYHTPDEAAQSWQSPLRPTVYMLRLPASQTTTLTKLPYYTFDVSTHRGQVRARCPGELMLYFL